MTGAGKPADPGERRRFLDARRKSSQHRYDTIFAETYDERWGAISPTHRRAVDLMLDRTAPGGTVLDAACGTGKYWPIVLARGFRIMGIDQSSSMLRMASAKHPEVPIEVVALQDLRFESEFDAVMCVDAMENIGPEDWPTVLHRLSAAARRSAPLYLTVELPVLEEVGAEYEEARRRGDPVVPGEAFDGTGYHFYPEPRAVRSWMAEAALDPVTELTGDGYLHLIAFRDSSPVR